MISGVVIKKIAFNEDSRGWLGEIYRSDFDKLKAVMCYVSHTEFGKTRGPHAHKKQSDFFAFIGPGDFELYLWDDRKKSRTKTKSSKMKIIVGESNKVSVVVPPGVVHGYKSVSKTGSFSINLPDKLYAGKGKKEKVDEIRYEDCKDSKFKIE